MAQKTLAAATSMRKLRGVCPAKRLVIIAMAHYADDHTFECGETYKTLAEFCCMTKPTLTKHIKELGALGVFPQPKSKQPTHGGQYRNFYDVSIICDFRLMKVAEI